MPRYKLGYMKDPRTEGPLTPRELEVVALVQQGLSNKEIGVRIGASEQTVKRHVYHALKKTGAGNRFGLGIHCAKTGLTDAEMERRVRERVAPLKRQIKERAEALDRLLVKECAIIAQATRRIRMLLGEESNSQRKGIAENRQS